MPTIKLTAPDGKAYRLTAPEGATDEQVQSEIGRFMAAHGGAPPTPAATPVAPDDPTANLGSVGRVINQAGQSIISGGKDALAAIPGAAGAILRAPGQIASDVSDLVSDPMTAIPAQAKRAGAAAIGMIPMEETLRAMSKSESPEGGLLYRAGHATGMPEPLPRDILREATSNALTFRAGSAIPRAIKGTVKGALGPRSIIPGVSQGASVELHSLAIPKVEELSTGLSPTKAAVDNAYDALRQAGGSVPKYHMGEFQDRVRRLLSEESKLSNPDTQLVKELTNFLESSHEGWTFDQVEAEAQRMGARFGSTPKGAPEGLSRLDQQQKASLLEALHGDVDAGNPIRVIQPGQPATPGTYYHGQLVSPAQPAKPAVVAAGRPTAQGQAVAALDKQARGLARRRFAATTLRRYIDEATSTVAEGRQSINTNRIIRNINKAQKAAARGERSAKLFVGSFQPGELVSLKETLQQIGHNLPPIPPRPGVNVGSYQRLGQMAVGELVGQAVGHPVIGTAAGAVMPEIIANALMTDGGRELVRSALKIDPKVGPVFQNTVAAFLRTQSQMQGADERQGEIEKTLTDQTARANLNAPAAAPMDPISSEFKRLNIQPSVPQKAVMFSGKSYDMPDAMGAKYAALRDQALKQNVSKAMALPLYQHVNADVQKRILQKVMRSAHGTAMRQLQPQLAELLKRPNGPRDVRDETPPTQGATP